jgi:hypothetical protein
MMQDDLFSVAPTAPKILGTGPVIEIIASIDGKPPQKFFGRQAWALHHLVEAGDTGCTPIDTPGPRWSDYVFKCRRDGVSVETIDEPHGGSFSGTHARYVLRSDVRLIEVVRESEARARAAVANVKGGRKAREARHAA